jgi:hypothetical protein
MRRNALRFAPLIAPYNAIVIAREGGGAGEPLP